jgi:hypothetical protein
MDFTEAIKEKRPHLSTNSLKTYNSCLRSVYRNCFPNDKEADIKKFDSEYKTVMDFLESKPFNVRKTLLAGLVCISPEREEYKKMMLGDIKSYDEEIDKQEENEKQKENNITNQEIRETLTALKVQADAIYKKKYINSNDLQKIQDYILVALLGGFFIVPRRAMDYTEMKYKNFDKEKDNYIEKNRFVYQKYKTAKYYGQQTIDMPIALKNIIYKYLAIIPEKTDYLLFNINGGKLTSVSLNQRLNKIFNGRIGINALRHCYLTEKYADVMRASQKMDKDLSAMGSSEAQAKTYVKLS